MSSQPKLTVSGYRGIWSESLTIGIAQKFTRAFISFIKEDISGNPTILLGRDGRESGLEIKNAIIDQLKDLGISYIDGDILPTPTVLFTVRKHNYDGAIIITASHNPIEYNGLKFVTDKALFASEIDIGKIKTFYENDTQEDIVSNNKKSTTENINENSELFCKEHVDKIISSIDIEKIRARKFTIAVDMINASACVVNPYLFEQLEATLIPLNNIPNGKFTHKPEPLKENLTEIAQLVKESGADVGFAHDPDADRLVVIDEKGNIISEEHTLALGVEDVLSQNPGHTVVINMSTSQMCADIAKKYNGHCVRTKVGEAYVVEGIIEHNALIGGEGTGSSIYPLINTARDSFTSLALVLDLLAQRNQTVSECVQSLPSYIMKKDKVDISGTIDDMYAKMRSHFKDAVVNDLDGLRLDFSDSSWIHLRPSNTEPIVRLYGEATTNERIESLFEETKSLF